MRIERLSANQFTIFLTFDDLLERGFTSDDIWHDKTSIQDLFSDMMYEASSELGFELEGMLLVQVHLMQAQGMHIIVTQKYDGIDLDTDFIEMKVTLDESRELIYAFNDFEHIIQVCTYLDAFSITGGSIYYYEDQYYMILEGNQLMHYEKEDIIAIMSEFSMPSILTSYRLKEYGKAIIGDEAVKVIKQAFH